MNPYETYDDLSDAIRQALDTGTHNVWLSELLADLLSNGDAVDARTVRRHLDSELLQPSGMEDDR